MNQSVDIFGLPRDKDMLVRSLRSALAGAKAVRNVQSLRWGVTRYWMQGVREFEDLIEATGTTVALWGDPTIDIRYEEAVSSVQQEIGRLMELQLQPVVRSRGMTLDGVRRAAVGHAALTYLHLDMDYEEAKRAFCTLLVHYGTVGLLIEEDPRGIVEPVDADDALPAVQGAPAPRVDWTPRFEVVPPWELLPLPGDVPSPKEVRATARSRWVTLEWLKARAEEESGSLRPSLKLPSKEKEGELLARAIPFGNPMFDVPFATLSSAAGTGFGTYSNDTTRPRELAPQVGACQAVELTEIWFSLDGRIVDRYIVLVGNWIACDVDYRAQKRRVPNPIGIARYFEVGGWYGRGYAELRLELNMISERMLRSVVRNVEDFDCFGITLLPRTAGVRHSEFRRRRDGGPRVATWEPDIMAPNVGPVQLSPVNSGGLPGEVLKLVTGLEDRILPQLSVFSPSAPRRIESEGAVSQVNQAANEPRSAATKSVTLAWRGAYRSLLWAARRRLSNNGVVRLVTFDDAVAGVVIDPKTLEIRLDKNALPEPHEVDVCVMSETPRNPQMVVSWLWEALKNQLITPVDFRIQLRKAGIEDMPVAHEGEWGAYQQAQLNNILLYGDGETGGEFQFLPQVGYYEVFLQVITDFMASPRYALASEQVRHGFYLAAEAYKSKMPNYPEGMPPMEDAMAGAGAGMTMQDAAGLGMQQGGMEQPDLSGMMG